MSILQVYDVMIISQPRRRQKEEEEILGNRSVVRESSPIPVLRAETGDGKGGVWGRHIVVCDEETMQMITLLGVLCRRCERVREDRGCRG